jgi:hypothetical protein
MSTTPSLAYGYLRVLPGMGIDGVLRLHHELVFFAKARGFALVDLFVEAHATTGREAGHEQ